MDGITLMNLKSIMLNERGQSKSLNMLLVHLGDILGKYRLKKEDQWFPGVDFRGGVDYKGNTVRELGNLRVLYLDCGGVYYMTACICLNS